MDLDTAKKHRIRLKKELEAYMPRAPGPSYVVILIAAEILRLTRELAAAFRSFADDPEVKIAVLNEYWMEELKLINVSALEDFQEKLVSELPLIKNFDPRLPLMYKFTQRVIEILEEEICEQKQTSPTGSPSAHSKSPSGSPSEGSSLYHEDLENSIEEAINAVIERYQEDASSDQVLDILKNSSIAIDDYVGRTVRKRFFEATFILDTKPAAEESVHCCSFIALIDRLTRWFYGSTIS